MFSNRRLLENIIRSDRELAIFSTWGKKITNIREDLPGYGTVWFHQGDIANILFLSKVAEKYRVAYDSTGEKSLVYFPWGEVRLFRKYDRGLFYSSTAVGQGMVLLNTAEKNNSKYSQHDYTRSLLARKLQHKIALPSHRQLVQIVENKVQMLNCLLNQDEVRGAEDICGNNTGCLKGKIPRNKTPHIRGAILPIPITLL